MPLAIALPPETIFHAKDVWPPVLAAAAAATGQLDPGGPPRARLCGADLCVLTLNSLKIRKILLPKNNYR